MKKTSLSVFFLWKLNSKNIDRRLFDRWNRISIRETLGNIGLEKCKKREVFGPNKHSRLSREWKMYGHLEHWVDVLRCLLKRVASSEKNIEIENCGVCINGYQVVKGLERVNQYWVVFNKKIINFLSKINYYKHVYHNWIFINIFDFLKIF